MGFFSKILKEINRPFKKLEQEIRRVDKDITHELERTWKNTTGALGFGTPKFPPIPAVPPPIPPVEKISGEASDEIRRRQRRSVSGRRETIVTGDLSPVKPGKKTLLGR